MALRPAVTSTKEVRWVVVLGNVACSGVLLSNVKVSAYWEEKAPPRTEIDDIPTGT